MILVEPDQQITWANDAALAMHGVRRLEELGTTIGDYRSRFELRYRNRHKLPAGSYPLDRLVAGESFSEVVVEVGRPGEEARWTHQIRSLVLTGVDGKPNCLVLIVNDVTEQFNAEERFERTFNANPAPAIICRLTDMRYVKVNRGFLELTAFDADALLGRSIHEFDILDGAEKRELAVERLHRGETIPQMEASLRTADGGRRLVLMAGQPIEIGDDACMLFTLADLETRKQVEDALRHSEQRFSTAFRLAPIPMLLLSSKTRRVIDMNDSFLSTTGYTREEALDKTEAELRLWDDDVRQHIGRELKARNKVRGLELSLLGKASRSRTHLLSAESVIIHDEPCVLIVMQDVGERKKTESELMSAIQAVLQDTSWFGQKVMEKLAELGHPLQTEGDGANSPDLSSREREVLGLIAQGLSDVEIVSRLHVSLSTVQNHVTAIYRKIGVRRRSAAVVWARERGFFSEAKSPTKPKMRRSEKAEQQP